VSGWTHLTAIVCKYLHAVNYKSASYSVYAQFSPIKIYLRNHAQPRILVT